MNKSNKAMEDKSSAREVGVPEGVRCIFWGAGGEGGEGLYILIYASSL